MAEIEERYRGIDVPRPPHWGGYRLAHETLEVWQGRANRLHDRFRYTRDGDAWRDRPTLALGARLIAAAASPSISETVCGTSPGPSQSFQIGLRPRTRGGSSSCTPPPGAGSRGSRGAARAARDGISSRSVAIV